VYMSMMATEAEKIPKQVESDMQLLERYLGHLNTTERWLAG
jgi:hypothetical protein